MKYKPFVRNCLFILFGGYSFNVAAQNFNFSSSLEEINSDGFYRVQLTPEIVSKLKHDFSDIRIFDKKENEVPYILEEEKPYSENDYFVEYEIVEKIEQKSWPYYTRIVLQNPAKNKISNINLVIKNSDVSKSLKLSGSDDNVNWYVIKDSYRFHAMYSDSETSVIQIIDFPLSNYEYYEILIDDWKNNPVNILKAGYFNTSIEKGKYNKTENPEISQLEVKENKETLVKIKFTEDQLLNKITLKIDGPDFYYRNAELQILDSVRDKRNELRAYFRTVNNLILSSNSSNTFYFDSLWAKELYLRIKNQDNQPVKIIFFDGEQLNHYLICKLHKEDNYRLMFGNSKLIAPEYDIKYFLNQIPKDIKTLGFGKIEKAGKTEMKSSDGLHLNVKIIWLAIVVVIIFLVYMVIRMLREVKNEKET